MVVLCAASLVAYRDLLKFCTFGAKFQQTPEKHPNGIGTRNQMHLCPGNGWFSGGNVNGCAPWGLSGGIPRIFEISHNLILGTFWAIPKKNGKKTHRIPVGTHHIPVGTHHIPVGTHHIPVGTHHIPVGTHHIPVGTHHIP